MDIGKLTKNIGLKTTELSAKGASVPLGLSTLGTESEGVLNKYIEGVKSTPEVVGKSIKYMQNVSEANYNLDNMTAREFMNTYESAAMDGLYAVNNYLIQTGTNLVENPLETLTASALVAGSAYLVGKTAQFWRTKGQGTMMQKLERKLGDKIWGEYK
ncbi:MAG: hypothetical protein ACMXX9_04230 [Candidatus Woesearchaeota archaeon]